MTEVEEFLAAALPRQREAEVAILNGDPGPRKLLWSHNDPVTVLGADRNAKGWSEVEPLFDWLGSNFSNCESSEFEVLAAGASGDLAYAVGFERTSASVGGQAAVPFLLRVTLIFRREDGEWKADRRQRSRQVGVGKAVNAESQDPQSEPAEGYPVERIKREVQIEPLRESLLVSQASRARSAAKIKLTKSPQVGDRADRLHDAYRKAR